MDEAEEFHLVEQCDPILWDAFVACLRPLFEQYAREEREPLQRPAPASIG